MAVKGLKPLEIVVFCRFSLLSSTAETCEMMHARSNRMSYVFFYLCLATDVVFALTSGYCYHKTVFPILYIIINGNE